MPGFIQPLHALIILLLHLSACSHLDEESRLSQDLVDQIFKLRVNHMLRWSDAQTRATMTGDKKAETLQKSNPRYRMLRNLRERVWHKVGWQIPSSEAGQGSSQTDTAMQGTSENNHPTAASANTPRYDNGTEDDTMTAALDNILSSDPMDMLQWDEWESISAGLFMN